MPLDQLGRPLTDLRISVTDRCSFRCVYCMPREIYDDHEYLARGEILHYGEMTLVARAAASLGVTKVRLTGGEPLLRKELHYLVAQLKEVDGISEIAMTTNAQLLAAQAVELAEAGLDRVTVSLDGLDDEVVRRVIDTDVPVSVVLDAIDIAEAAGLGPIKINAVIRRGWNEDQVIPLVEHFRGTGHTVRFIEFMDVGTTNSWNRAEVVPTAELVETISARWPLEVPKRSHASEVAETYAFADGAGSVGFISSVTAPFCGDCSRLRLSAEGQLFTCLFATEGTDVKAMIRDGATSDDVAEVISRVWTNRDDQYSQLRGAVPLDMPRVEMSYIGG